MCTSFTQSQRNIFSFMWKRTTSWYSNLGISQFSLFVLLFLTCCFAVPQLTFGLLLKGQERSTNVDVLLLPFLLEGQKELHEEIKDTLSGLRKFLATGSPLKMMKNAFYFTSKTLFLLKIFKFLSWFLVDVAEQLDKKDQVNFKFYDVTAWLTNNYNTHIA